jgi:hypothetical protein
VPILTKRTWMLAAWFAALLALSLFSRARIHARRAATCSLDGQRIAPVYEVDLVERDAVLARFCCTACAAEWPDVPPQSWWRVRDEVTGEPLDAEVASFVESSVITNASRRCRTHAFKNWSDAMNHAATYGGERVADPLVRGRAPRDREQDKNDAKHE